MHHTYPYSCFQLDGMIGRDFFDDVILHFDYASKTFRLTKKSDVIPIESANKAKLKLSHRGLPTIKLKINTKSQYIEFDSGSGDFYSPKTGDVEKAITKDPQKEVLKFQGKFSFGVTMDNVEPSYRYMEKIESFQLATTTFSNFYSQFSKISAPRIGAAILKYGKVTLDFKNSAFYYEPYAKTPAITPFETFGFDIAIEDGNYIAKYVLIDSEAYTAGIRSGNTIVRIDNMTTQNVSEDCEGYLYGYPFKKKPAIQVTYLDNLQKEVTVTLHKKTYP